MRYAKNAFYRTRNNNRFLQVLLCVFSLKRSLRDILKSNKIAERYHRPFISERVKTRWRSKYVCQRALQIFNKCYFAGVFAHSLSRNIAWSIRGSACQCFECHAQHSAPMAWKQRLAGHERSDIGCVRELLSLHCLSSCRTLTVIALREVKLFCVGSVLLNWMPGQS